MWIVTQDRKTILHTYKVYAEGNKLLAFNNYEYCLIGEFKNKDQAKEELKRITHSLILGTKVYEVNQAN